MLIDRIKPRGDLLHRIFAFFAFDFIGRQPAVFPALYFIEHRPWWKFLVINIRSNEQLFNQALLVVIIENGELRCQPHAFSMAAQNPRADGMKCA